ncbi:hypothetical protein GCM10027299_19520 [Larkinella ripae]
MNDEFRLRWTEIGQRYGAKDAIWTENRVITYADLFRRANQYAVFLVDQGIRQTCVPVLLDEPVDHLAALLGVLLSGNYYHSVNRHTLDSPDELVRSVDCGCLISESPVVLPNHPALITLIPETLRSVGWSAERQPTIQPGDPFCLFTTSGSTGRPKQVIHSHQSVLADTFRQITDNEIGPQDRIDLLFSLEFSASLACIFPALLTGATLVFHDLKTAGVLSLPVFWQHQRITFSSLSVSTFRTLLKTDADFKTRTDLRMLSIGAEPVRPDDVTGFQNRFSEKTVLQVAYATTETRTISEQKIRTDTPVSESLFSVGKPVNGRTVTIQSETGSVLPPNQIGEIVVQARFIPSAYPNNAEASQRAYRVFPDGTIQYATGDLGFLDATGHLFWCGRTDFVVKINGQKVSLMQLEQELKTEPGVKNAAVIYDTSSVHQPRLKAFLCTEPGFDLARLKPALAQRLPAVMLPDRYGLLDALPLTKTGKLDRLALAAIQEPENRLGEGPESVETDPMDLVPLIKRIWQSELGLTTVLSDYDDFFYDLGGDSLTAESGLARLEKALGKTVPVHAVFSYTTPKALAYYLMGYGQRGVQCIPLNQPVLNRKAVYFIPPLPGERRMYRWIENHLNQDCNLYYIHYEPYTVDGELRPFSELVRQIAQAIARPAESMLVGFSFGGLVAYQVALALEQLGGSVLNRLVLLDTPLYRRITFRESLRKDARRIGRKVFAGLQADPAVNWSASWQRALARYRKRLDDRRGQPGQARQAVTWQDRSVLAVHQYVQRISVQHPVSCPILLFRASDSSAFQYEIRPDFRWKPYTTAGFDEQVLEANHDQVLNSVNSDVIGTVLSELLR